jgi:MFS family permease
MISYGGVVSFVSLYARETGTSNAGLFFIMYASGIYIARLSSGRIFDRKGPMLLSINGLCCLIIGFLVLALLKNPAGFLGSALILGIGSGVLVPTFQAMINNLAEPHRRGAANSTLFTALDLGIGTGMILIGYLAGKTGLSTAFLICSLLNATALLFFLLVSMKHYTAHSLKK